jgi:hypothetical protein
MVNRIAHVHLPDDMRASDGGLEVPGFGHLPPMHSRLESGGIAFAELEPGRPIIATMELGGPSDPATPMTLQEMRDSLRRVLGVELPIEPPRGPGPHALRRIDGQNTRQADRYRAGNVFLVGDSAHVHSAMGGPGLNLGLQDAMNLGWKLAAEVNGWAPGGLLDTYQTERYPVGERVMMHSLSQTALMMPGPEIAALRQLFGELLQTTDGASHVAHMLAGSDVRYDVADNHPLAGRFVPDLTLAGGRRVTELLRDARPVLLDLSGGVVADTASQWRHRVDIVIETAPDCSAGALLIRPDGYIVWAADTFEQSDEHRLREALRRWCGAEDSETAELTA